MNRLAIIGSAGRKDDADKLTLSVWNDMKRAIYRFVTEHEIKDVISGGASFADHLAVGLFNAGFIDTLTLALPCEFDWNAGQFLDTGYRGKESWKTNPGATSNYYHQQFSRVIGKSSLEEIKTAIYKGAKVEVGDGLMARNSIVAGADIVIALTFGDKERVKPGGTSNTCQKYLARGGKLAFSR